MEERKTAAVQAIQRGKSNREKEEMIRIKVEWTKQTKRRDADTNAEKG